MLLLLSPAKTLDFDTPTPPGVEPTAPRWQRQAAGLIRVLRRHTAADLAALMHLSAPLAELNVQRYRQWRSAPQPGAVRPALFAFNGGVYGGLDARSLSRADWAWAQQHLRILSGLYGLLSPLDGIQPHRLEMGTRLDTGEAPDLYGHWGGRIAKAIERDLAAAGGAAASVDDAIVVNLASQEYFKSVRRTALKARVIECVFQEQRGAAHQVIGFMAKRARGLMVRHAITHRLTGAGGIEGLKTFQAEGYTYAARASQPDRLVFRRKQADASRCP